MPRFCARRGRALLPLVLSVCWAGCSRPGAGNESAQVGQQVPFRGAGEAATGTEPAVFPQEPPSTSPSSAPFHDLETLPAGTLLSVRLKAPIVSLRGTESSNAFTAVLDDPVVLDGMTVLSRGGSVEGHFESTRPTKSRQELVRLTLSSINVGGRDVPVETSVLFARGKTSAMSASSPSHPTVVTLEKGRRLTFQLTEAVDLGNQLAKSSR